MKRTKWATGGGDLLLTHKSSDRLMNLLDDGRKVGISQNSRDGAADADAFFKNHGPEPHPVPGRTFTCTDERTWDSLITGYIRNGKLHHGLVLYDQIYDEDGSMHPSEHTFVALLKTCAKLNDRERGARLHDHISRIGLLDRSLFVANALVHMYCKCGLLENAKLVCDRILFRDAISWTALISGYVEHGCGEKALDCFKRMLSEGIFPSWITFVCSLKACACIGAMQEGLGINAQIEALKLPKEQEIMVGTALVDMYAKCGSLIKAMQVFDRLTDRDVVAWNALVVGYTEHGHDEEVLKALRQMQLEGIPPDSITLFSGLRSCLRMGTIAKGQAIQAEIERNGFLERGGLGNAVVDLYVKHGLLSEAKQVFDKLQVRDVAVWNMLISGYVEQRQEEQALECFKEMQLQGLHPSAITYACCLKACGILGAIDEGREMHAQVERLGLPERNSIIGNALVEMYINCGLLGKAHGVFDGLRTRDVVSWTSLISGYADHGEPEQALNFFEHMMLEHVVPNAVTFLSVLKACGSIGNPKQCEYIHCQIEKHGLLLEKDHVLSSMLVDTYAKCGLFSKVWDVVETVPVQDVVFWNTVISGYVQQGHHEEAFRCFEKLYVHSISPNAASFVSIMKACCSIGSTDRMTEIHAEVEKLGLLETCDVVGSSLVDMYFKSGNVAKGEHVFHKLRVQDRVSWTILMGGYAQLGEIENALLIFERMLGEGIKPDPVTFLVVLKICTRAGSINKVCTYFESMTEDYGIIPTLEHYVCMINLLGRLGQLGKALAMIKQTLTCQNLAVWRTFLSACRNWNSLGFGKQAFEHAIRVGKKDAISYVFMSHIYASCEIRAF